MEVTLFKDMVAEGWFSMDRYANSLADQLSTLNFPFSVFCAEPPLGFSFIKMFYRKVVYPRLAQRHQGDINHILDHSYGHLLNCLDGQRTVVTCHDLIPLDFETDQRVLNEFQETVSSLARAKFIITDSESTKKDLIEKLSISTEKIETIPLGVNPIFHPLATREERQNYVEKFNLPKGRIILSFGNNLSYKNVEGILRAFSQVLRVEGGVYLVRVGSLTSSQAHLVQSLGIADNYLEVKKETDEDLVGLYNCADVFLSPSFKEGFGLPVLEALACGLPVVISAGTSLAEIAGKGGVYVNPTNTDEIAAAVLGVLRGQLSSEQRGMALVDRAALFSWEKTARQTAAVYERLHKSLIK